MPPWNICLRKSKCGKYIPRRIRKWNEETSSGRFAVSSFGEPAKGSKGVELPCKFRMCPDRVHPVQNGMPFCETCLSSPPRFQWFLRGVDAGKAASERALLFPHLPPRKNLQKPPRGMIVVLWFFAGVGWRKAMLCFRWLFSACPFRRKITRLQSSRPAPIEYAGNINHNSCKNAGYICSTHHRLVSQFVIHKCKLFPVVLHTVQHCLTYCATKK